MIFLSPSSFRSSYTYITVSSFSLSHFSCQRPLILRMLQGSLTSEPANKVQSKAKNGAYKTFGNGEIVVLIVYSIERLFFDAGLLTFALDEVK